MLAKLTSIYRIAKQRIQKASKVMAEAWTDKGNGMQYPVGADTSAHSGYYKVTRVIHDHSWTKGIIPAGEVRICKICGQTEKV